MTRVLSVLAAVAVCLAPVIDAAAPAPSRWTRLRTPNFVLLGEQGDKPLRRVAERLEQFKEVFGRVFPSTRQTMPAPIVVHVFGSERAYQPFMPRFNGKRVDVGGYFQQTPGAYYITLSTAAGETAYPVIYHEYVHLLVGNTRADVPAWFNEGLAEYYSTYEMYGEREATLGKVHEGHVYTLRERFIPLAELLAVNHRSPLYNEGDRRGVFYAESWALVHYLLIGNAQRQGQLATFLEHYEKGTPTSEAVKLAFGVTEAQLEKELRLYVSQSLYRSTRFRFGDKVTIDKDWRVDQPSDADGQAELADLLLASRRLDDAAARAEAVLQQVPEQPRALAVLGRVRALQGRMGDAVPLFDRAVKAAGDADYLPSYYQAVSLLRPEGEPRPITTEDARRAVALLKRVTTLQPALVDGHGLVAYGALFADEPQVAKEAAAMAYTLSPRHEFALFHARARVRLSDGDVRPALTALATRGSEEWIRNEAKRLLEYLAQVKLSGMASSGAPPAGSRVADERAETGSGSGAPPRTIPVFRPVAGGELRVHGVFEGVECGRDGLVFKVRLADRVARVSTKAFDQVEFFTYRTEPPGQVGCGPRPAAERVYLTYRSGGGAAGTDGVAVALELLPDDFKP